MQLLNIAVCLLTTHSMDVNGTWEYVQPLQNGPAITILIFGNRYQEWTHRVSKDKSQWDRYEEGVCDVNGDTLTIKDMKYTNIEITPADGFSSKLFKITKGTKNVKTTRRFKILDNGKQLAFLSGSGEVGQRYNRAKNR